MRSLRVVVDTDSSATHGPGTVHLPMRSSHRSLSSQFDPVPLLTTSLPGDPSGAVGRYTYDEHGNMRGMPGRAGLGELAWNDKEELHRVDLGGGGNAYYQYDAAGQRVRKLIVRNGGVVTERIYLGGYEVFRELAGDSLETERQTLHVMDDQDRVLSQ